MKPDSYLDDYLRIGIDIGGTFTDFVIYSPVTHKIHSFKLITTPNNPSSAVLTGIKKISSDYNVKKISIIHGSTVATNALLEGKGAVTALVTSQGFKDLLVIGRQNRPDLYNFFSDPPSPLVKDNLRLEVEERIDKNGNLLLPLNLEQVYSLPTLLKQLGAESVAICLLFSYINSGNEKIIAEIMRKSKFYVSASSEILPEFREYERMSTTVVNAYVSPVIDKYLSNLEDKVFRPLEIRQFSIMQSNGGVFGASEAKKFAANCILSGPAGGINGAFMIGKQVYGTDNVLKLITLDMGGTSTDVSLINGAPIIRTDSEIGGYPLHIPMIDIHTIGAGGGSIASVDLGGGLRVGPESAGADPGPACYGLNKSIKISGMPTVTDANVVLGRIITDRFLGGEMPIYHSLAFSALEALGKKLNLDAMTTALGVVEIINAHMERALRVISVERGNDPEEYSLLAFGGAGGLHAVELARRLGIPEVIIPPQASTLSAYGMLAANLKKNYVKTVMMTGELDVPLLENWFKEAMARGSEEIKRQGVHLQQITHERFLDVRYRGQSYELTVPYSENVISRFHEFHKIMYGYKIQDGEVEVVNQRVYSTGYISSLPDIEIEVGEHDPSAALIGKRPVVIDAKPDMIPAYDANFFLAGNRLVGPALIIRPDTTILLYRDDEVRIDNFGNLIIKVYPS